MPAGGAAFLLLGPSSSAALRLGAIPLARDGPAAAIDAKEKIKSLCGRRWADSEPRVQIARLICPKGDANWMDRLMDVCSGTPTHDRARAYCGPWGAHALALVRACVLRGARRPFHPMPKLEVAPTRPAIAAHVHTDARFTISLEAER